MKATVQDKMEKKILTYKIQGSQPLSFVQKLRFILFYFVAKGKTGFSSKNQDFMV